MSVCPAGHDSTTDDFCDVCGEAIDPSAVAAAPVTDPAPATAASPTTPPPSGATIACAGCGDQVPADALFCEGCGRDLTTGQMPPGPAPAAAAVTSGWVMEQWVDTDWFALRGEGRCPTAGAPRVHAIDDGSTIGRPSKSRHITPDVDCSGDGAVSARHAVLHQVGDIWSVTDVGSTNGTYVGAAGDGLPQDPIAPQVAVELGDLDRIFIGAHTRLVIRRATADGK